MGSDFPEFASGELGLTLITMGTHEEKTGEPEAASCSKSFHDLGSCCDHLAISMQEQVECVCV